MIIAIVCACGARVRLHVQRGIATGWKQPNGFRLFAAPIYECECGRQYRALDSDPWIELVGEER